MKSNIDLTFKRDFHSNNDEKINIFFKLIYGKVPWRNNSNLSIYEEMDYAKKEILVVGSKIDRKKFKEDKIYYTDTCERCGIPKTKIPWNNFGNLCKECENELKMQINKKDERICWL